MLSGGEIVCPHSLLDLEVIPVFCKKFRIIFALFFGNAYL